MLLILALIACYLLGAIPFSYLVARRVKGLDLTRHGSGNLGATNVFRTLGPLWGVLVLVLDMAKGAAAVALMTAVTARWPAGQPTPLHLPPDVWRILAGFVAALGHTLSPFVGFRGGKGVATTAGAFFFLAPYPMLVALVVFTVVVGTTRIVSLASLSAASILPLAVFWFEWNSADCSWTIIAFTTVISAWVIVKHRANIRRLLENREAPLSAGNGDTPPPGGEAEGSPGTAGEEETP